MPSLYQAKFGKIPEWSELGFPKLKNFLTTMKDVVELEEFHKNHIKVKLKNLYNEQFLMKTFTSGSRKNRKKKKSNKHSSLNVINLLGLSFSKRKKEKGYKTLKQNPFEK